jgi:hydrogenase small subunit
MEADMGIDFETGFGVGRRDFLRVCTAAAAAVGLPAWAGEKMAETVAKGRKPSVIWLHYQECTGCTESLLRSSAPDVGELILDLVSLDYHETLFAASGAQIEAALEKAIEENRGKFVLVVEGAIPLKDGGIYCTVGGKKAVDTLKRVAADAAAVIAIGSCASWGGIPSSFPNPTQAVGVPEVLKGTGKAIVTLPGCPANPYNLLGTVLQFATFGSLPKLDEQGRPLFAYARVIHEDCQRRPHFDAGRFAQVFGDEGHRNGWCLYKLGCKGPQTHANCSLLDFCEVPGAWPVGIGHPCVGCTEQGILFGGNTRTETPIYVNLPIDHPTAPAAYPGVAPPQGKIAPVATAVAGLAIGAVAGAAFATSRKLSREDTEDREGDEKK